MRVLFVTPKFNLVNGGGSNHSLHLMASGLSESGHSVKILHLSKNAYGVPDGAPYQVLKADAAQSPASHDKQRATKAAYDLLRQYSHDADIFHLYGPYLALPGGLYKLRGGSVPVAVTLNNYELFCTRITDIKDPCYKTCGLVKRLGVETSLLKKAARFPVFLFKYGKAGFHIANKVDQFLPVSGAVKQIYSSVGFNMSKSSVIRDVIDYRALQSRVDAPHPRERNDARRHILYIGRLAHEKGLDILIKAVSMLGLPFHLHIVGDGPERGLLAKQVQELHMENSVTFYGWIPSEELWQYYRKAHLYVHPARWPEPCSRAVIEALAFRLPAIVSDTGGSPWIVGNCGSTFKTDDAGDLAEKIRRQCLHYDDALLSAARGDARALEFDYRRVVSELQDVYKRILNG